LEFTNEKTAIGYGGMTTAVDHNIKLPKTHYTVGVKQNEDRTYGLTTDFYDRNVVKAIGKYGNQLKQSYATCVAEMEARKKGYSVMRQNLKDGKVRLTVRVP